MPNLNSFLYSKSPSDDWHGWSSARQDEVWVNKKMGSDDLNINDTFGHTPKQRPAHLPFRPSINLDGITHPMRGQSEKMMAGKMFGGRAYGRAGMHAPGLLGAAIGFGTAGYYGGNQDGQSVAAGVAGGFLGGKMANWGQSQLHSAARSMIRTEMHSAEKMSGAAFKAVNIGKMMTHSSNRGMIFAAGGLLGGALFSKMFAGNGSTYKRGLNAHRGNSIER